MVGLSLTPEVHAAEPVRLVTLAPGHFHAALVHKKMPPGVSETVSVYAPLGFDLTEHLRRLTAFNTRPDSPTTWKLEVYAGPDFLQRMLKDRAGNVVVISGRNRGKIDLIEATVEAGLHALVDKPWVIEAADLPRLAAVLEAAQGKSVVAYDVMTERFETTNALQRDLVNSPKVFGTLEKGTPDDPAVTIENVHHFMKVVSGAPNIRPAWFFDSAEQGEGMADTGTHLVDLVHWTLFPEKPLDHTKDVAVLSARRWPTRLTQAQFSRVTGLPDFPADFRASVKDALDDGTLAVFANTQVTYTLAGAHVSLTSMWDWEAEKGAGDWHYAVYRGTRARIEVRQGRREKHRPEVYVVANDPNDREALAGAVAARLAALGSRYQGVVVEAQTRARTHKGREIRIVIPEALRVGHEPNFSQVTRRFLGFLADRRSLPAWEKSHMLAKYFVTTKATLLSRENAKDGKTHAKAGAKTHASKDPRPPVRKAPR
jgi:predicted dehydrogenase